MQVAQVWLVNALEEKGLRSHTDTSRSKPLAERQIANTTFIGLTLIYKESMKGRKRGRRGQGPGNGTIISTYTYWCIGERLPVVMEETQP